MAPDHYEILRLSTSSDPDTIDRVYRTLAKRFHPDNEKTGDAEIFLRVAEAHRVLTDPRQRKRYDAERDNSKSVMRFDLRSRDFFAGLRGEQNRRLAVLCLLYRKRSSRSRISLALSLLDLGKPQRLYPRGTRVRSVVPLRKMLCARINDHTRVWNPLLPVWISVEVLPDRRALGPAASSPPSRSPTRSMRS